jgi:diguanylate cyclase (GGDEF)-like protein
MTQAPVPLIVLSGREDDVELVNRVLRDGGHPVRCHWITKLDSLPEAIDTHEPQLLCFFPGSLPAAIREVTKLKQQATRAVPLLVIGNTADETEIADAMAAGAKDLVSLNQTQRLRSVAERELRAFRLECALNQTLLSANQYKRQLKSLLAGSVDAIAHVQEGIIVDGNQAWAELFGYERADAMVGVPLMDMFEPASQATLKGALIACGKGHWKAEPIKVLGKTSGGSLRLDMQLEHTAVDGEPAVKLSVARPKVEAREPEELVEQVVHKDPATGFFHRRRFLEVLTDRLDDPPKSGVRALAYIRPDKFRELEDQVGPLATEDVLIQLAAQLGELVQPQDLCGRFGGQVFTAFLERGSLRDIEAWAQNAVAKIGSRIFRSAHNTVSLTCTIGLAEVGPTTDRLDALLSAAKRANQQGRAQGGNRVLIEQTSDESTRVQRFDEIWVHQIKAALRENRFRLMHLPIANLNGEQRIMFDTLLRMVDAQGDEIAAAEFIPAAGRNRLLRAIDRWVIGASLSFCARTPLDCVFIKLSGESLVDKTLMDWLAKAIDSANVRPEQLCFQVSEDDATQYLTQTQAVAKRLNARGHLFAIEHFGVGRDSGRVLIQTPMQYLKLDGSLMENLATDPAVQEKVRVYVGAASKRGIPTIAERVENANTMAVLFQLGAAYVQGHYVHEPEVVLADVATIRH